MSGQFEAMLETALTLGERDGDAAARAAAWRQTVDILAQAGLRLATSDRARAFERLAAWRAQVPLAQRRMAAASLAGRTSDAGIVAMFAADAPVVAAPFLTRATLADSEWRLLMPTIPPASRNILRNRRDLSPVVQRLLADHAPGDLALPQAQATEAQTAESPSGTTQIRDLVERIEAYRARTGFLAADLQPEPAARAERFAFETDLDGTIDWVDGAPREALIGTTIAQAATTGEGGVDGGVAGAWRRRAPFSDARLSVGGEGGASGGWLISGMPLFNPADGRFTGYRGQARRPLPGERVDGNEAITGMAPDSLRQLVHELRTPLGAIHGFAEMIERQMLGPAAHAYREHARSILSEADRLVTMIDDLDAAARLDSGRSMVEADGRVDPAALVARVLAAQRAASEARRVQIVETVDANLAPLATGAAMAERMVARLISAATGVAMAGEAVAVGVRPSAGGVAFEVTRPSVLAGVDDRALLDPDYGPDGEWPDAPLLGLGFTLRLVARLASQHGGSLVILPDRFGLILPVRQVSVEHAR